MAARGVDLIGGELDADDLDRLLALRAATSENAPVYLAVLGVLDEAKRAYRLQLRTAEIRNRLNDAARGRAGRRDRSVDGDEVDLRAALDQLRQWGCVSDSIGRLVGDQSRPEGDPLAPWRDPSLERLWSTIRKRLENNGLRITAVPLKLTALRDREIEALCGLLGRRRPTGDEMKVDLRRLDELLESSASGMGLLDTLEALGGPLRDRAGERLAKNLARLDIQLSVDGHPAADDPAVRRWIEQVRRRGLLTRLETGGADAKVAMIAALDGLAWLLANGDVLRASPIPLATLAAMQSGDAHALDPHTPVGALLADALTVLGNVDDHRSAWGEFGVQLDQINSSALALNLPGSDGSICAAAAAAAQPLRVTWRMVERGFGLDRTALRGTMVRVCENPTVVAMAADSLGVGSAPLVCTEGMPAAVTSALLGALYDAGADLGVHADFDVGGVAITRHIIARFEAAPWRMSAANYLGALDGPTTSLGGPVETTPWDPRLAEAMTAHGRAIHEEALIGELLDDLAGSA